MRIDRGGFWVVVLYVVVLLLLSALVLVGVGSARAEGGEEGIGEAEPAKAYELPEDTPGEPAPPPSQHDCPDPPDVEAAEVEYSVEATQLPEICLALADRLDRVRERSYWTVAELMAARKQLRDQGEDLDVSRAQLEALRAAQCEPECVVKIDSTEPVTVTGDRTAAEEMYGPEIVSAINSGSEGTSGALWFLIGVCVVAPIGVILWSTVKRAIDL